jgi:hypothetical protein
MEYWNNGVMESRKTECWTQDVLIPDSRLIKNVQMQGSRNPEE